MRWSLVENEGQILKSQDFNIKDRVNTTNLLNRLDMFVSYTFSNNYTYFVWSSSLHEEYNILKKVFVVSLQFSTLTAS